MMISHVNIQSSALPISEVSGVNQNKTYCLSLDDTHYWSPTFLEQVKQLEIIAREKLQKKKRVDFSPLGFSLSIY